ncbi:hypothetical protein AJ80_09949 [Polytolypa hystricis UAMH7299]|uniref:Uncharacterized protein n=1 Tax=Polytolypa hystricis (strain UAMH7299) TaxID=1447883 RepID=A0A2B7W7L9_POLH7|nr:hypothetical protein AJ80_09949 [Polytolypa hystricis UAMH7299]
MDQQEVPTLEELLEYWSNDASDGFPDSLAILDQAFLESDYDFLNHDWSAELGEGGRVPAVEDVPSLSPSPEPDGSQSTQQIVQLVGDLLHRVQCLEDELRAKSQKLEKLNSYVESLQPFLSNVGSAVRELSQVQGLVNSDDSATAGVI